MKITLKRLESLLLVAILASSAAHAQAPAPQEQLVCVDIDKNPAYLTIFSTPIDSSGIVGSFTVGARIGALTLAATDIAHSIKRYEIHGDFWSKKYEDGDTEPLFVSLPIDLTSGKTKTAMGWLSGESGEANPVSYINCQVDLHDGSLPPEPGIHFPGSLE